ncbi:hypothetical protein [Nitratifractor sp.]
MIEWVLLLVYTSVLLLFFSYPAMRIAQWLSDRFGLSPRTYRVLTLGLTILFSLLIAAYLRYG